MTWLMLEKIGGADKKLGALARQGMSPAALWRRFRDEEHGTLIVFALFIFVLMLMAGGMAVDFMRFETVQTKLQNTSDRAALAAADLNQPLPPAEVVADYFAKEGLSDYLDGVTVDEGVNYRVVNVQASATINTLFLHMSGIDTLTAPAGGQAEEKVTDVEISLVVDVSGSMTRDNRLVNLKVAAEDFIEAVIPVPDPAVPDDGMTTMSIIPYSAVVNIGADLDGPIHLSNHHGYSTCPLFDTASFNSIALDTTRVYERVAHFEYGGSSYRPIKRSWCPSDAPYASATNYWDQGVDTNDIVVLTDDKDVLKQAILDLEGYGNTAIDLGMKWGVALLDPSMQPVVSDLVSSGVVPVEADGRPAAHDDVDTLKVVVLMTDGANTTEYDIAPSHKSGLSNIWVWREDVTERLSSVDKNRISILVDDNDTPDDRTDDTFFNLDTRWDQRESDAPKGFPGYSAAGNMDDNHDLVTRLTWPEIYAYFTAKYLNYYFYREPYERGYMTYSEYRAPDYALIAEVNADQADGRLSTVCQAARDENIVVYTIAYNAPNRGQTALLDCASSISHHYNVNSTNADAIGGAFASIASQINKLRLTQ